MKTDGPPYNEIFDQLWFFCKSPLTFQYISIKSTEYIWTDNIFDLTQLISRDLYRLNDYCTIAQPWNTGLPLHIFLFILNPDEKHKLTPLFHKTDSMPNFTV